MFSCEFCEISKSTFLYRTPPVAASGYNVRKVKLTSSVRNMIVLASFSPALDNHVYNIYGFNLLHAYFNQLAGWYGINKLLYKSSERLIIERISFEA